MNPDKKVLVTFLSFVLVIILIACSCSSIIPTTTPPTVTPIPPNPMPGLEGTWHNPDTNDVFEIAWQNNQYVVQSVVYQGTSYNITSQSWTGSSLTWSYYDEDLSLTVTVTTTSLSGDSLNVNWSLSDGSSGSATLLRGDVSVTPEPQPFILTGQDSLTVTSAEAGVVTSGIGASIAIPAGAVPANDDGSIGSMIFSITQDSTTVPSLPGGFVPVGPVVNLGPEGFVFEQPVTFSLSIPADVDPNTVMGGAYYHSGLDTWFLVPGSVDAANRTVEVATTHLSTWSAFGYGVTTSEDNVNGGWFKVYRPSESTGYKGPDSRYSRASTSHGICIRSVTYTDPNVANWWLAPLDYSITAYNLTGAFSTAPWSDSASYWMPSGSYELTEFYGQSEINEGDPLYLPRFYQMWRDLGTVTLQAGQTVEFPDPDPGYNDPAWTLGRPPCWGTMTTSVGVGDLQVTLNWNSTADIDLHVVEPGGDEIFWDNTFSPAGGKLDRDNWCNEDFVLGRPENIFWSTPPHGTYQVSVVYYEDCGGAGPVNFTVRICIKGNCTSPIGGTINAVDDIFPVTSFTYP